MNMSDRKMDIYNQLMAVNHDAFDAELFDTAYHALAGALHCAKAAGDQDRLIEVSKVAKDELLYIDQKYPEYRHSTKSASKRGNESIFSTLAREAGIALSTIRFQPTREKWNR